MARIRNEDGTCSPICENCGNNKLCVAGVCICPPDYPVDAGDFCTCSQDAEYTYQGNCISTCPNYIALYDCVDSCVVIPVPEVEPGNFNNLALNIQPVQLTLEKAIQVAKQGADNQFVYVTESSYTNVIVTITVNETATNAVYTVFQNQVIFNTIKMHAEIILDGTATFNLFSAVKGQKFENLQIEIAVLKISTNINMAILLQTAQQYFCLLSIHKVTIVAMFDSQSTGGFNLINEDNSKQTIISEFVVQAVVFSQAPLSSFGINKSNSVSVQFIQVMIFLQSFAVGTQSSMLMCQQKVAQPVSIINATIVMQGEIGNANVVDYFSFGGLFTKTNGVIDILNVQINVLGQLVPSKVKYFGILTGYHNSGLITLYSTLISVELDDYNNTDVQQTGIIGFSAADLAVDNCGIHITLKVIQIQDCGAIGYTNSYGSQQTYKNSELFVTIISGVQVGFIGYNNMITIIENSDISVQGPTFIATSLMQTQMTSVNITGYLQGTLNVGVIGQGQVSLLQSKIDNLIIEGTSKVGIVGRANQGTIKFETLIVTNMTLKASGTGVSFGLLVGLISPEFQLQTNLVSITASAIIGSSLAASVAIGSLTSTMEHVLKQFTVSVTVSDYIGTLVVLGTFVDGTDKFRVEEVSISLGGVSSTTYNCYMKYQTGALISQSKVGLVDLIAPQTDVCM